MSNSEKRSVARKLSVYLLAAGLAGFTGASTTTQATMLVYNNGGVGWSDGRPNRSYTLDHHYLVAGDVPALLARGGLVLDAMYCDFADTPFVEEEAERMVVVARRA